MTAADTSPDLFPPIPPEPAAAREPRLRPLERRIIQAVALLCAVSGLLAVQWVDEKSNVEKNLKPPERVVSVRPETVGEFLGARWMALKRETAQPLASGAQQGDVTELRFTIGVRPDDAAAAKLVGGYGLGYRFVDGEGRHWSADGTVVGARRPQQGVSSLITVKGTVPRAKADALKLEIQAPKASRKAGDPLLSLRFER